MDLELLKIRLQKLKELKTSLTEELKVLIVDKSIPLEERWEIFFESDLGEHCGNYEDFKNFNSDLYCGDVSKYETLHLRDVEDYYWFANAKLSSEQIVEFKEDVLEKFIKSFEFDW